MPRGSAEIVTYVGNELVDLLHALLAFLTVLGEVHAIIVLSLVRGLDVLSVELDLSHLQNEEDLSDTPIFKKRVVERSEGYLL